MSIRHLCVGILILYHCCITRLPTLCDSSTTIYSTCPWTLEDLSLRNVLNRISSTFSTEANRSCGKGLCPERSSGFRREVEFKPRERPEQGWSTVKYEHHTVRLLSFWNRLFAGHREQLADKTFTKTRWYHSKNILFFQKAIYGFFLPWFYRETKLRAERRLVKRLFNMKVK